MRCSRCDAVAVPQAVGRTPTGELVFGWCVRCLEEAECHEVRVAQPDRRPSTRLVLEERSTLTLGFPRRRRGPVLNPARRVPDPEAVRRRAVELLATVLALWGTALIVFGLLVWLRPREGPTSPLGNGTPALLLGGGGATLMVGLLLWWNGTRPTGNPARVLLRLTQALGFLGALALIGQGVVRHEPKRNPVVVAAAGLALAVSATARWAEVWSERR